MREHLNNTTWRQTPAGDPRGYIDSDTLSELWFHTGTSCNLSCPFCFEGSRPGDKRIAFITLEDARPLIDEAVALGVEKFSFTGGEPFVNPHFLEILEYALAYRPCLVLTNGTAPLRNQLARVLLLRDKPHALSVRVSLDYPEPDQHDAARGEGTFALALDTLGQLHAHGFHVSIARLMDPDEDIAARDAQYRPHFAAAKVPEDTPIIKFPDFLTPGQLANVPDITESCMTTYTTEAQRAAYMCNFSRMVLKQHGTCGIYACTLVDDDPNFNLGATLQESLDKRIRLKHHRCYSCFAYGSSCSEGA